MSPKIFPAAFGRLARDSNPDNITAAAALDCTVKVTTENYFLRIDCKNSMEYGSSVEEGEGNVSDTR